tara:strand:- start:5120 stop:5842 length:723 start_codon:yes stop_codon:yes gene_type:complete
MAKQRKGLGLTSFATGFAKGASQGIQMGMYRAMQQQKAGMTENEKKAKEILGYKTGIKDPKTLSEITIIAQELRRGKITPDEADNLMDAKGLTSPASFAPPPKTDAQLSAERAETLRKESRQRGEQKEPGYVLSAKDVTDLGLTTAPLGQVWWMSSDGNPTLKGKAKEVAKALKPIRMEHIATGQAEWFNWDPAQESFIYQSGTKAGDQLTAKELTNYKPPSSSDFLEMMRLLLGSQPQP